MQDCLHILFLLTVGITTVNSQTQNIGGYRTVTDVAQHLLIDLDVKEISSFIDAGNYEEAARVYENGENSVKGSGASRTLQGFSTGLVSKAEVLRAANPALLPEFFLFAEYYGDEVYGDTLVSNLLTNSAFPDSVRKQFVVKGIQYQIVWMYVLREFYEALLSCQNGDVKSIAWDEGVAFYTGSLVGDGSNPFGGSLQYTLAEKRASKFGGINANPQAFLAFENGKVSVLNRDCQGIQRAIDVIRKQMLIPVIQGTLQYSQLVDPSIVAAPTEKYRAEAWAFTQAWLPFADQISPEKAAVIDQELNYFRNATYDFINVHKAVFDVVAGMCITCEELGIDFLSDVNSSKPVPSCVSQDLASSCPERFSVVPGGSTGSADLFSVPAFFIVFREALEAAIICSILLAVVKKTGDDKLRFWVWVGIAGGLVVTICALTIVIVVFEVLSSQISLNDTLIIRGALSISAAILIGYIALTLGDLLGKDREIQRQIDEQIGNKGNFGWKSVLFLSFTTVSREGIETVIFLGVGSGFEGKSLPLPVVIGAILGIAGGLALYRLGSTVAMKRFIYFSVVLLVFIGAGVFAHGIEEFQVVNDYGEYWEYVVWNISKYASLRYEFFGLMRALVGFTPYPSRAEVLSYCMYHVVLWLLLAIKYCYCARTRVSDESDKQSDNSDTGSKEIEKLESGDASEKSGNNNGAQPGHDLAQQ